MLFLGTMTNMIWTTMKHSSPRRACIEITMYFLKSDFNSVCSSRKYKNLKHLKIPVNAHIKLGMSGYQRHQLKLQIYITSKTKTINNL